MNGDWIIGIGDINGLFADWSLPRYGKRPVGVDGCELLPFIFAKLNNKLGLKRIIQQFWRTVLMKLFGDILPTSGYIRYFQVIFCG